MRIIISYGYQKVLLSENTNISAVVAAFDGAETVIEEGYGTSADFRRTGEGDVLSILIVKDSQIKPKAKPEPKSKPKTKESKK